MNTNMTFSMILKLFYGIKLILDVQFMSYVYNYTDINNEFKLHIFDYFAYVQIIM